jgi:uncharacterized protein (DUF849 family)
MTSFLTRSRSICFLKKQKMAASIGKNALVTGGNSRLGFETHR